MAFAVCTTYFSSFLPSTYQTWKTLQKLTSQRLVDQNPEGPYIWKNSTYPSILGLFGPFLVASLKGSNCLFHPFKIFFCPMNTSLND